MYLNPLRDFLKRVIFSGGSRQRRVKSKSPLRRTALQYRGHAPFSVAAEVCESRTLLSGPALITVSPNTGGFITNGTVENTAPTQLAFTFSPTTAITNTAANLANISVTRSGGDGAFGSAVGTPAGNTIADVPVTTGSIQVDPQNPNLVTLRFANALVVDTYQIKIAGTLGSSTGNFNGGADQTVTFTVDYGAQVISVVPQPILRNQLINVNGSAASLDGQSVAISTGGGTPVTFFLKNSGTASVAPVGPNNVTVTYNPGDSNITIAGDLANAIQQAATPLHPTSNANLIGTLVTFPAITNSGTNSITLSGTAFTPNVVASQSQLNILDATKITDGDTFAVTYPGSSAIPVTFQFKDATTNSVPFGSNVAVTYNPGDPAATLAAKIRDAVNGSTLGAGTASVSGTSVVFRANPLINLATSKSGFLSVTDGLQIADATGVGALTQAYDTIDVYLNQDPLVLANAQNPAFYQVVNTADGSILEPSSVTYNKAGNTAVLKFSSALPTATLHLTVGAPLAGNSTTATATNLGTLYSNGTRTALQGALQWGTGGGLAIVGTGTNFNAPGVLKVGQFLQGPDGLFYAIAKINNATSMTLATPFLGTPQSGVTTWTVTPNVQVSRISGTFRWVNSSATLLAVAGGAFTSELKVGQLLQAPDGNNYQIASIASNSVLTLTSNYAGLTTQLSGAQTWTSGSATVAGVNAADLVNPTITTLQGPDGNVYTILSVNAGAGTVTFTAAYNGPTTVMTPTLMSPTANSPLIGVTVWTNGWKNVTGVGTHFTTDLHPGSLVLAPDGNFYRVSSITSDTLLAISAAYTGDSTTVGASTTYTNTAQATLSFPFQLPGTTIWTKGSAKVTTPDMNFLTYLKQGDFLLAPDGNSFNSFGQSYQVAAIAPDGKSLTLGIPGIANGTAFAAPTTAAYTGPTTVTGVTTNYSITPLAISVTVPPSAFNQQGPQALPGTSTWTTGSKFVTNNNASPTGGENYLANLAAGGGDFLVGPDGLIYGVQSVVNSGNNTSTITLAFAYNAAGTAGVDSSSLGAVQTYYYPPNLPGGTLWTNGSKQVTGAGTSFLANLSTGDFLLGPDGLRYKVAFVNSNTSLTLTSPFAGLSTPAPVTTAFDLGEQSVVVLNSSQTRILPSLPLTGATFWTTSSPSVTGVGTKFTTELKPGYILTGPDGISYAVQTIASDTLLTLKTLYHGDSTPLGVAVGQLSQSSELPLPGTSTWTAGSKTVATSVDLTAVLQPNYTLVGPDGAFYHVSTLPGSITATTITLTTAFAGATTSGANAAYMALGQNSQFNQFGQLELADTTSWTHTGVPAVDSAVSTTADLTSVLQGGGQIILGPDGNSYQIALGSVTATGFTLTSPFAGTTQALVRSYYQPTNSFSTVGYLGNASTGAINNNINDVNLYQFTTSRTIENVTINASNLAPAGNTLGSFVTLRLFDSTGAQVPGASDSSHNALTVTGLTPNSTYYVGVSIAANTAYNPTVAPTVAAGATFGSYSLSINVNSSLLEPNDTTSFATATNVGTIGAAGFKINGKVAPIGNTYLPPLPGGSDTPGNRNTQIPSQTNNAPLGTKATLPNAIPVVYYNFQTVYGADPQGNPLQNAITANQIQDARQIFDMYGQIMGVKFVETASSGITVATGDIRAYAPSISADLLPGITYLPKAFDPANQGNGEVVIISAFNPNLSYGSSQYGGAWFNLAFQYIGKALGLSPNSDAPGVMSGIGDPTAPIISGSGQRISGTEPVYPGNIASVPAHVIFAPNSTDINLYKFQVTQAGTFSAESQAQRMTDANGNALPSTLDTVLTLYSDAPAPANSAKASDTFTLGGGFSMTFTAKAPGTAGNGIAITFTKADLGAGSAAPSVTVNSSQIGIVLNTHAGFHTTALDLQTAIANDVLASNLVSVSFTPGNQDITAPALTALTSSLTLNGGAGARTVIASNDNYFGTDSFLSLHLAVGTYYLAVTSTGNTHFDPSIADSGSGGTTDGAYQLKMSLTPDPLSSTTLNDAGLPNAPGSGGIALDGDGQQAPGGTFNFWFQTSSNNPLTNNTFVVDKANAGDLGQVGTTDHPYGTISAALQAAAAFQAATPGTPVIVRIVGNGGADGNRSSTGDNLPYLIGFDTQGNPEQDGSTFIVPKGVTVMIDEGALLKLHSAVIDVGDTTPNVDRGGSALQILGTPTDNVIFTSLFNDAIGGRSDALHFNGVLPGDWGGIVYQQTSDFQGKDYQGKGVYLNSVNQANLTYGGGQVFENAVLQTFAPIFVSNVNPNGTFFARPAIWFNTITLSAGAALSADPNSFANTEDRFGPDVYGNYVANNTINGFFVRIRTAAGQPIDTLGISARIAHTDITYVLTQNLLVNGNPGGNYEPDPNDPTHTGWQARLGATLVIDPGVILKMSSASIQMQVGNSQLIAEGTATNRIIFTSLADDAYGADGVGAGYTVLPGTFDTNADGSASAPNPNGDWGGLFFNADSKGSIDHAVIQYAGGTAPISSGLDFFNPIEIQQAKVRIADSLFQFNGGGMANTLRDGLLMNDAAAIFVRGAQPVIADNIFIGNAGYIISIDANALNSDIVPDWGRSTGDLSAFTQFVGNHGPLVALNQETGNGFNGMEVRAEQITTQTIWDDSDIVHIVTGEIDDVINQHTFGGISIESSVSSSLVVKLLGPKAGFFINGVPLDFQGRIGGALQLIGTPNNPVILTSLNDNTIGAGFQPNGQPSLVTNGAANPPAAAAGDWAGITLSQYSNDRNVASVVEQQPTGTTDNNGTAATAQNLGTLAPNLATDTQSNPQGGNDYQPLGFSISGTIGKPSDVDVYSFTATGQTEVWFQIGLTSPALASVLELVDSTGNVLAFSNPSQGTQSNPAGLSQGLAVAALSLMKVPSLGGAYYSSNPRDAGMRVILPGTAGTSNTYFIRVRSAQALTQGQYTLQVRLRQQWESPGSLIQYATINDATNGIQIQGLPKNSPLSGDATSLTTNNTTIASATDGRTVAQNLGNMLASNKGSLSVAGTLNTSTQVDWYKFNLNYDLVQAFQNVSTFPQSFSTIFNVQYAAGLSRPDTTLSVYDATGTLIFVSRDSGGVAASHPQPLQGTGLANLSAPSFSNLDPFLGPAQLPAGNANGIGPGFTYFVAISSNLGLSTAMDATFNVGSTNQNVRLQPVTSVQRIVEDHIGFTGYTTGSTQAASNIQPTNAAVLPINTTVQIAGNVVPYSLSDVIMYTVDGSGNLWAVDAATGNIEYKVGGIGGFQSGHGISIKMRDDGTMWAYEGQAPGEPDGLIGQLAQIDPATGAATVLGNDGIPEISTTDPNSLLSDLVDSFAWQATTTGPGLAGGTGNYNLYYAANDAAGTYGPAGASRLYLANPNTGVAVIANTPFHEYGEMVGAGVTGATKGMAWVPLDASVPKSGQMFGATSGGQLVTINVNTGALTLVQDFSSQGISFTGLTLAPQNLANPADATQLGFYRGMLFATTTSGNVMVLDLNGNLQNVLAFQQNTVPTNAGGIAFPSNVTQFGLTLAPLDFNLWHPTLLQNTVAGHGISAPFTLPDNSIGTNFSVTVGNNTELLTQPQTRGGASYYFGLENFQTNPLINNAYMAQDYTSLNAANFKLNNGGGFSVNAQYGVVSSTTQKLLTAGTTAGSTIPNTSYALPGTNVTTPGGNYDLPGGAHGSLVTNGFSLAGVSAGALPTLYFNYMLGSDSSGIAPFGKMTDSARVFASADNGLTWFEIATSNVTNDQGVPGLNFELPQFITPSVSANPANAVQQVVQPLFNTQTWRQARIDLSSFAGQGNVKLRFDFSTSGTTYNALNGLSPLPGDVDGVGPFKKEAAANNNFPGWLIDDIIVGVASRGEMVTNAPNAAAGGTGFFAIPRDPNIGQSLTGPYQLEIRPGQPYAFQTPDFTGTIYYNPGAFPFNSVNETSQTPFVGMNNSGEFPQTSINTLLNFGTSIGYQPYNYTPTAYNLGTTTVQPQFSINQSLTPSHTLSAPRGSVLQDNQTFTIDDGVTTLTFEFNLAGSPTTSGFQRIQFSGTDTNYVVARNIRDAINAAFAAGKFKVTASQSDGTITGTSSTDPNVNVLNAVSVSSLQLPALTVQITGPTSLAENGVASTTGVVVRQGDLSHALTVNLSALNIITTGGPTDVTFSGGGLVSFLAGQAVSAPFTVTSANTPNNLLQDGTFTLAIIAAKSGYVSVSQTIDLNDVGPGSLGVSPNNIKANEGNPLTPAIEGGVTQTAFVFRNTVGAVNNVALAVTLTSLTPSRLSIVTPNVIIPAGATFTTFQYKALQDNIANDPVTVNVLATATGLLSGEAPVAIQNGSPDVNQVVPNPSGTLVDITRLSGNQSEGAITIDRTNGSRLFAFSNNLAAAGMVGSFSVNAGATWTRSLTLDGVTLDGGGVAFPAACCDPSVTADDFGNLFVSYLNAAATKVIVLFSTDFGQTFKQIAGTPFNSTSLDQPTIVAAKTGANGSLWLTYRDFGATAPAPSVMVSGATITGLGTGTGVAGAIVFSTPSAIALTKVDGNFGDIAIGPGGAVAVAYENPTSGTGPAGLFVSVNPTGVGGAFGAPVRVTTTNVGGFYPIPAQRARTIDAEVGLAWDRTSGRLYMVYTDSPSVGSPNTSIFTKFADFSFGALGPWSASYKVNDFVGSNSQFMPRISVDNGIGINPTRGDVVVSFYDTRNDQGQGFGGDTNGRPLDDAEFFTAASTDNGVSFGTNIQISTAPSNSADANDPNDYGDYTGLDFNNGVYYPMWADNSTAIAGSNPDGALSSLDMVTERVTFTTPTLKPTVTVAFTTPVIAGSIGSGTVTLQTAVGAVPTAVLLTSSDTFAAAVPNFVIIPAFTPANTPISFSFTAGFSGSTFGAPTAIVTPTLAGFQANAGFVDVENPTVGPALALTLSSPDVVAGGTVVATLSRNTPNTQPLTVALYVNSLSLTDMPTSIIMPAGQSFVQFTITGVLTNGIIDQTLALTAAAPGLASGTATLDVRGQRPANYDTTTNFFGDQSIVRPQGHLQIIDNTISNSLNVGISVTAADLSDPAAGPAALRNLPTLDTLGLVGGPNIVNNVVANFGTAGIRFWGDVIQNNAGVPYGRIVNNTIYGGATQTGIGIDVEHNAAPVLMNNIVANTATGIVVEASSMTKLVNGVPTPMTFVATTYFQNNGDNGVVGNNAIIIPAAQALTAPLFVKPSVGNFYLAEGSRAIDSSLNSVTDTAQIAAVLSAIGLPPSPIIAPLVDRFGQLRVDDPNVPNASGLGQNIFIDRGALERADFTGPTAQLTAPLDNGADDGNPAVNNVFILLPTALPELNVQLSDVGVGIDNTTVTSSDFILKQDGVTLVDGTDYKFVYNVTTHTARFEAISVFPFSSNYTISIPKVNGALPITDLAGNTIQPNQADGTVLFTIIGNRAPTITSIATQQGIKNTTVDIPYGPVNTPGTLLFAASPANLNVVAGHIPEFIITSIPSGTLTITKSGAVTPIPVVIPVPNGTTIDPANQSNLVAPGDVLHWNPNSATFTGSEVGFTVIGLDPTNAVQAPALSLSTFPAAPVNFNVIDPSPLLASDATLGLAALNPVAFPISYATLVTNLGASWIEATLPAQKELQITSITTGTLRKNGVVQSAPFVMGPSDSLTWTPPAALPDPTPAGSTDHINAFTVQAFDGFNAINFPTFTTSAATHTVFVNVLNVTPPTVVNQNITLGPKAQYVPSTILYSDIQNASGASLGAGNSGDTLAFRLESIDTGSVQIIHNGATSNAASGSLILPGDTVIWTSDPRATGTPRAFTVTAFDVEKGLDGFTNIAVSVNLVNIPPTLSNINPLGTANQQTPFNISYVTLLSQSDAFDANNDSIQFRITSVQSQGTLTLNNAPALGQLFSAGQTLVWTGAAGVNGSGANAINAFTVTAFDGTADSSPAVQVKINVQPLGAAFDLSGPWAVNSGGNTSSVLGRISQNGTNFTIVNSNGIGSSGKYTQFSTISVTNFNNQPTVTGTIDTTTADNGRIIFSDGTVWLRISLGGTYSVTGPGIMTPTLGSISQNGSLLSIVNGSATSATISNSSQIQVSSGGGSSVATYGDGRISFSNNGQVWTKLDLPVNYTNLAGDAAQIIENGASLTFSVPGASSPGTWISPTQVSAFGQIGTVGNGQITWSGGNVWSQNLVVSGSVMPSGSSSNAPGTATIAASLNSFVTDFTNMGGNRTHIFQNGSTLTFVVDGLGTSQGAWIDATHVSGFGQIGTVGPTGNIAFSGGNVWTVKSSANPPVTTAYTNIGGAATHIVQDGALLTLVVDASGESSSGFWISQTQFFATDFNQIGTVGNGKITWSGGNVWTASFGIIAPPANSKVTAFTNRGGITTHVYQSGSFLSLFLDSLGVVSPAYWISPTQFFASAFGQVGTVSGTKIFWSGGNIWSSSTTISPGTGALISITDNAGQVSNIQVTSLTTIQGVSGPMAGQTATRVNGRLFWSGGAVWNNFDFNDLNALFEMGFVYP